TPPTALSPSRTTSPTSAPESPPASTPESPASLRPGRSVQRVTGPARRAGDGGIGDGRGRRDTRTAAAVRRAWVRAEAEDTARAGRFHGRPLPAPEPGFQ